MTWDLDLTGAQSSSSRSSNWRCDAQTGREREVHVEPHIKQEELLQQQRQAVGCV
jgi:hypothetical protein